MLTKLNETYDVEMRLDCGYRKRTNINHRRKFDTKNLSDSNQLIEFISNKNVLSRKDQYILNHL